MAAKKKDKPVKAQEKPLTNAVTEARLRKQNFVR